MTLGARALIWALGSEPEPGVTEVRRENAVSDGAEPGSRVRKKESHQLGARGRACVSVQPFGSCRKGSSFLCCEQDRPEGEASGEVTALEQSDRRICLLTLPWDHWCGHTTRGETAQWLWLPVAQREP